MVFTLYGKETESEVIFVAFDSVVVQKCRRTSVRCNLVFNGHQATVADNVILGQVFPLSVSFHQFSVLNRHCQR